MSDTITLRDHSKPCGHSGALRRKGWPWQCVEPGCPGGREVTLRRETDRNTRTYIVTEPHANARWTGVFRSRWVSEWEATNE